MWYQESKTRWRWRERLWVYCSYVWSQDSGQEVLRSEGLNLSFTRCWLCRCSAWQSKSLCWLTALLDLHLYGCSIEPRPTESRSEAAVTGLEMSTASQWLRKRSSVCIESQDDGVDMQLISTLCEISGWLRCLWVEPARVEHCEWWHTPVDSYFQASTPVRVGYNCIISLWSHWKICGKAKSTRAVKESLPD